MTTYVRPAMTYEHARSFAHVLVFFYPQLLSSLAGKDRISRGVQLARLSVAHGDHPGLYDVESQSQMRSSYQVDTTRKSCTCKDSQAGHICKHRIAVAIKTIASDLLLKLQNENRSNMQLVDDVLHGREI